MIDIEPRTKIAEIVGHGAIAKALHGVDKPFLFFASGVANSHETDENEYNRERDLLLSQDPTKHIVYFTSLCVLTDPTRRYSQHKMEMEDIIRERFSRYSIVRLGNPEWSENPHQLIPFFRQKLESGEPFEIYNEYRHILTKEEFLYWINLIPEDRSTEFMLTGRMIRVEDIVKEIISGKI